jgi:hypothetical protein
MAVHAFAHAVVAVLGEKTGLVELIDEIVEVVAGLENDVAAAPAIAAAGAALGPIRFALKGDCTFAAVSRSRVNFDLIDKHL